ncbi:MAG: hypothetical protein K1X57_14975 [Gemmataceae bacterium]|nr:hypothetical protein [Gemmataceae bacterium]
MFGDSTDLIGRATRKSLTNQLAELIDVSLLASTTLINQPSLVLVGAE